MDLEISGDLPSLYIGKKRLNIKSFLQLPEIYSINEYHNFIGHVIRPKQEKYLLVSDDNAVYSVPYRVRPKWVDYGNIEEFAKTGYSSFTDHNRDYHLWCHVDNLKLPQIFL